ncbi:probable G-protein coupled receptor 132 [Tiliqua scincoides]|uniref:probable G-protein coupled receptor 132 n=1 Tax=Tiliqua scincoides TaxID=71010 RepID=UPI003462A6B4
MRLNHSGASFVLPWGPKSSPLDNTSWREPSYGVTNITAGTLCPANASRCGVDFQEGHTLVVWLYGSAFLLGLATNSVTLRPLLQKVRLGNTLAIYLLSLVVSDLLYLFTLPLWIVYVLRGHRWPFGGLACHVAGFLFYSNMYVSIFLLCAISLERYLAVVHPLHFLGLRSCLSALLVCASVVLLVFLAHVAILLSSEVQQQESCYDHYPLQPGVAMFNYFRVALGFALPLIILEISYLRIVQGVRASETLLDRQKVKVQRRSLAVIAIFLLCFAPYHILLLARSVAASLLDPCSLCAFEQRLHLPFFLSLATSSFNSALDPILYTLVSNEVKEDLKKAFSCRPRFYPVQGSVAM